MNWLNNFIIYLDTVFHNWGFHFYDIPALVLCLIMAITGLLHWLKQNKRDDDHEEELKDFYEDFKERHGLSNDTQIKEVR
jgi:nicotinamide riboside transporter PnuC